MDDSLSSILQLRKRDVTFAATHRYSSSCYALVSLRGLDQVGLQAPCVETTHISPEMWLVMMQSVRPKMSVTQSRRRSLLLLGQYFFNAAMHAVMM